VQRQKESAGGESIDGWNLVVGSELDAVDDATLVVEIDEVIGREPGNGRDALEGVEPEAGVGVGSQSFDEDLDGFQRIGAGIDKRDTGGDEVGTSLVVGAILPRGHGSQSTVNVRHKTDPKPDWRARDNARGNERARATKKWNKVPDLWGRDQVALWVATRAVRSQMRLSLLSNPGALRHK
jgi:hypothetical protein